MVLLQHPRERDVAIGTARMTHLSLPGSRLVEGLQFDDHPALQDIFDPDTAVLYPGPDARPLEDWLQRRPRRLVVVDGTWSQAKKLLRLNPRLAALPRLSYSPTEPGNYRIRREPTAQHLSTIEATAAVLGLLEGDPERFRALLRPFTWMVDHQIDSEQRHRDDERVRRFIHRNGRPHLPELGPLRLHPERAVVVYGEGNSQPGRGPPELTHLVASRPLVEDAPVLDLIVAPGLPLHATLAVRIGVPEATIRGGLDVDVALDRFRDYVGGDQLVCWGGFVRDLLEDAGDRRRGFVDVRALAARQLRRSAGGLERACAELGAGVIVDETAPRALRCLRRVEGILRALMTLSSSSPSSSSPSSSSSSTTTAAEPGAAPAGARDRR